MTVDPRIARTRIDVFAATRTLLATDGAMSLTFSTIAQAAGIARKTLYAHWESPAHLLAEFLADGHSEPLMGLEHASEAERVQAFREDIAAGLSDPATRAAITYLMAAADAHPHAADALAALTRTRAQQLGELLGRASDVSDLAEVAGPVFFTRLVAGTDPSTPTTIRKALP
ncbi:MAG: TetR family transcriptional regulator [Aeromicrobium sp.]|nr:MAG: TetR family transcriptional regulator [Aeromicrobium sp.]